MIQLDDLAITGIKMHKKGVIHMSIQTVGTLLDGYFTAADKLIPHEVKSQSDYIRTQNVIHLRRIIEDSKVAFAELSKETVDKVDASTKAIFDQLSAQVDDIKNSAIHSPNVIDDKMAEQLNELSNRIPYHNDRPSLSGILPSLVFKKDPLTFNFSGDFNSSEMPILKFNNQDCKIEAISQSFLKAEAKLAEVFANTDITQLTAITFREGELHIPWTCKALNGEKLIAIFKVTVGMMPPVPGQITLNYSTRRTETQNVTRILDHSICSRKCCGNNDQDEDGRYVGRSADADPGWLIDPNTAQLEEGGGGTREATRNKSVNGSRYSWEARTIRKAWGTSGWYDFRAHFTQYRTIDEHFHPSIDLKWNDTKTANFAHSLLNWNATVTTVDGQTLTYDENHAEHASFPYLEIHQSGNSFRFTSTSPEELKDL
jgi:hypothetical protein